MTLTAAGAGGDGVSGALLTGQIVSCEPTRAVPWLAGREDGWVLPTPYAESVLDLVATIPRGRVMTYGDVAGVVGGSALSVGQVMSRHGSGVPWWRVVKAGGLLPPGHEVEAARRLTAEGTRFVVAGERLDLTGCRWSPNSKHDSSVPADRLRP